VVTAEYAILRLRTSVTTNLSVTRKRLIQQKKGMLWSEDFEEPIVALSPPGEAAQISPNY